MLKIATFVEFCPPRLGSDRRIFELLSRLDQTKDVHFVVFPPGRAFLGLVPFPHEHRRETSARIGRNLCAHYLSVPSFLQRKWSNFLLGYLSVVLFVFPKAVRKLKTINPDIIVLNYPSAYTGLCGFLIGRILRKKIITEFNDIIAYYTIGLFSDRVSTKANSEKAFTGVLRNVLVLVQNYIVRHADLATALTTYTKRYAKSCGISKPIHLIPDGVDTTLFDPSNVSKENLKKMRGKYGLEDSDKIILYIGRLEKWAGVDLILRCAKHLRHSDAKFLLVGEGRMVKEIAMPNIICCGRVSHELVVDYLAMADVVLVPMQQDPLGQSASPLKLFEAMAMGKPVIASDTQGIRDVIRSKVNGILLPSDEKMWAGAILEMIENSNFASTLGRNARETVESGYNWSVLVNKFEELLYQLVES